MFNKVLIANRGEIAVRIIRACKELGIQTVAVYSTADKNALHVKLADESVCIGSEKSSDSYLNAENILSATIATKANAIHPGFGFLSENETFARMCDDCNIKFIGPRADVIELMGNKSNARTTMQKAKVPVIPGSNGTLKNYEEALHFAKEYGYPVMIKASYGGGGKGIRIASNESELRQGYENAKTESMLAFGNASIYIEKVITNAKHIEVQILGDDFGNVVHLFDRDCSMQRKNQKVIEEAPAFTLDEKTREKLCKTAVRAGRAVGYTNAGTIEFLVEGTNFYFMEMNTRVQVEHPITEMITGVDIIKEQIKIAQGEKISFSQKDIEVKGHAVECRINAEDPDKNFMPCPGLVTHLHYLSGAQGYRFDSCVYSGYKIPPYYDSMVGKLITYGNSREEALSKMRVALDELDIQGITTNINFQKRLINSKNFRDGNYNIKFIEEHFFKE